MSCVPAAEDSKAWGVWGSRRQAGPCRWWGSSRWPQPQDTLSWFLEPLGSCPQGYLEETPLPDTAAPAEMRRPFSPHPLSLSVCSRVERPCACRLRDVILDRPPSLPLANNLSNHPLLLLQRYPIALQKGFKTWQLCFKEFAWPRRRCNDPWM